MPSPSQTAAQECLLLLTMWQLSSAHPRKNAHLLHAKSVQWSCGLISVRPASRRLSPTGQQDLHNLYIDV
jgi:hypothetical protein